MKQLISNPVLVTMLLGLFVAIFAFLIGRMLLRRMRRSVVEDALLTESTSSQEQLPLHMYHAVIQQLKQQKHELQSLQQAERRRAKTSDNISAAILSNLSSGVVFFTTNGLVRQSNAASKQILGFASPVGMTAEELFRVPECSAELAEAVHSALQQKMTQQCRGALYKTPAGEERILDVTVTVVRGPGGELLGAACLINDCTEIAQIRRQIDLRGELSGEMAFELRNSLATISGYAQQLAASRDPDLARQLAADIAAEAAHLDRTIGGFLVGDRAARAATKA